MFASFPLEFWLVDFVEYRGKLASPIFFSNCIPFITKKRIQIHAYTNTHALTYTHARTHARMYLTIIVIVCVCSSFRCFIYQCLETIIVTNINIIWKYFHSSIHIISKNIFLFWYLVYLMRQNDWRRMTFCFLRMAFG